MSQSSSLNNFVFREQVSPTPKKKLRTERNFFRKSVASLPATDQTANLLLKLISILNSEKRKEFLQIVSDLSSLQIMSLKKAVGWLFQMVPKPISRVTKKPLPMHRILCSVEKSGASFRSQTMHEIFNGIHPKTFT